MPKITVKRDDLNILLAFLKNVKNSEYVSDQMMEKEAKFCIKLVEEMIDQTEWKLGDI